MAGGVRELFGASFMGELIPFPHDLITSQRPQPPNTITLEVRISTWVFGVHKHSDHSSQLPHTAEFWPMGCEQKWWALLLSPAYKIPPCMTFLAYLSPLGELSVSRVIMGRTYWRWQLLYWSKSFSVCRDCMKQTAIHPPTFWSGTATVDCYRAHK